MKRTPLCTSTTGRLTHPNVHHAHRLSQPSSAVRHVGLAIPASTNDYVVDPLIQPLPSAVEVPHLRTTTLASKPVTTEVRRDSSTLSPPSDTAPGVSPVTQSCPSSIMCSTCGKCHCTACTTPRTLPQTTLCHGRVTCSPSAVIEACTCVTLARHIFYYSLSEERIDARYSPALRGLSPAEEGYDAAVIRDDVASRPCACHGPYCCMRWTCLLGAGLVCPCLWFYWPLYGCLRVAECLYDRCKRPGCRCDAAKPPSISTGSQGHVPLCFTSSSSSTYSSSSCSSQQPLLTDHDNVFTHQPLSLRKTSSDQCPSHCYLDKDLSLFSPTSRDDGDHSDVRTRDVPPPVPPRPSHTLGQGQSLRSTTSATENNGNNIVQHTISSCSGSSSLSSLDFEIGVVDESALLAANVVNESSKPSMVERANSSHYIALS